MALLRRRKAEDYYEEAMRLLQAQYYAAAFEATDKAIGIEPEYAQAHQLRGEALDAYRQASKLDPAITPHVQYRIARELNQLGNHTEALEAADTAIGLNPPRPRPRRRSTFRGERRGAACTGHEPHCARCWTNVRLSKQECAHERRIDDVSGW